MSELKVINAYIPTFDADHNVMLLVSHTKENYAPAKQIECYLKSEADKVIAHHNYKRCLAMARWCEATALWCYQAANTLPAGFHATLYGKPVMIEPDRLFKRHALLTKWSAKWQELAEKFKEAK